MEFENQHVIPHGYLKAWACPTAPPGKKGCLWVIQKNDPDDKKLRSPKKHFSQKDRYTVNTGNVRVLNVEKALNVIETDFGKVRQLLDARRPLTQEHRVALVFFAAAMMTRVESYPERVGGMLKRIQQQAARQAARHGLESTLSKGIETSLARVSAESVSTGMPETAALLWRMKLSIFVTDDEAGFITSDNPCCLCVPRDWHPYLAHPDAELTFALTPYHLAFFSWKTPALLYRKAGRKMVDEANSRTIAWSRKEFVSKTGVVRQEWLPATS